MFSCQKDSAEVFDRSIEIQKIPEVLSNISVENGVLAFKDVAHFNSVIDSYNKPDADLDNFLKIHSNGFKSYKSAVDKFRADNLNNEDEREAYLAHPNLFFLMNWNGESFFESIIPESSTLAYLVNDEGNAQVGNEIWHHEGEALIKSSLEDGKIIDRKSVVNTYSKTSSGERTPCVNCFSNWTSKRKMTGQYRLNEASANSITFRTLNEKKVIWGWTGVGADELSFSSATNIYYPSTGFYSTVYLSGYDEDDKMVESTWITSVPFNVLSYSSSHFVDPNDFPTNASCGLSCP